MAYSKFNDAKIMIVDDEPGNIHILERILKWARYTQVLSTTNSLEAARLYQEFKPDIILLDLKMPGLNGYEVMAQLREIECDSYLPVLILTAQRDRSSRLQALESGAKDFIQKPFDTAEVLLRIGNIIETRLLHKAVQDQNMVLEEKVRERTKEVRHTRLEVINRLGRAAEYRDNETGMHIIRMSRLSARLAQALGMNEEECELILNASPMHDVGKIGIPDHILLKPGKLNQAEWEIMKMHPAMGAEILSGSNSEVLKMAEVIAITHQERWDGSGYPKGLKGEGIPFVGRLVALCDVFDALTSKRPYKEAFPVEEALIEIENQSGKLFDPHLVKTFKEILPDMIQIIGQNADSKHESLGKSKLKEILNKQAHLVETKNET